MSAADLALMHLLDGAGEHTCLRAAGAASSAEFTKRLTRGLAQALAQTGASVEYEHALDLTRSVRGKREYRGIVDLFATFDDGSSLAIEIDRGNKRWSLDKLEYAARELGSAVLWVRWRGEVILPRTAQVPVLDLTHVGNNGG